MAQIPTAVRSAVDTQGDLAADRQAVVSPVSIPGAGSKIAFRNAQRQFALKS